MKSRMNKLVCIAGTTLFLALRLTQPASATILVQESFTHPNSTDNLVGTTADIGGTWTGTGNTGIKADGTVTGGTAWNAFQAFTLVSGRQYTLSADLNPTTTTSEWFALGFSLTTMTGSGSAIFGGASPYAWMLLRTNGGVASRTGVDLNGVTELSGFSPPRNLKILLDTTGSPYKATFYVDNTLFGTANQNLPGTPALTQVFIGTNTPAGTFDNFLLEDDIQAAVPEPSAYVLGLLGLGGLGFVAWRKRRQRG